MSARQVADVNPGAAGSFPTNIVDYGSSLFFSASSAEHGEELFEYNGSEVSLAANINDTTLVWEGMTFGNSSSPRWLTTFDESLFFSAYEPRRGAELWRFEGGTAERVTDLNPDVNDTIKAMPNSSWPSNLTVVSNLLFFTASAGSSRTNYELWKYDGAAVSLAANIHPNNGLDHSSYPSHLTRFNQLLVFSADDGANGFELWKHDGQQASLIADLNAGGGESSSFPKYFTPAGDILYFAAFDTSRGYELWKTDGNSATVVGDINSGTGSSYPEDLTMFNGALYFRATDGISGYELWKSTGTEATLAADIFPGGDSYPKDLVVFNGLLCFAANDSRGWELWKFDGTTAELVIDLNPSGDSFPEQMTVWNNALYFSATTLETGYELWRFDGSNVTLAADINPGSGSSFPQLLTPFGNQLFFRAAENETSDWEPWVLAFAEVEGSIELTGIEQFGSDIRIRWTSTGTDGVVIQAATQPEGPYANISGPLPPAGEFIDAGAIGTNSRRFYRLTQP